MWSWVDTEAFTKLNLKNKNTNAGTIPLYSLHFITDAEQMLSFKTDEITFVGEVIVSL
jgi:hypothetical protein